MKNMKPLFYISPEIQLIDVEAESILCFSGDIEPITEEDWDE